MATTKVDIKSNFDDLIKFEHEILNEVGKYLVKDIRTKMNQQVDINDVPYEVLSANYGKRVTKKNPSYKILVSHTGKLYNSINWEVIGSTLRIFTDTEYADYHNEGTSTIPKRQFLPDENSKIVSDAFEKGIDKFFKKLNKK